MLYMAANTPSGLLISLAIDEENLNRVLADDPLMARLSYCGYRNGLFFLFPAPKEGGFSKRMKEIIETLKSTPVKLKVCACGLGVRELGELREGRFISIEPGVGMPGIFQITLFYHKDHKEMIRSLRMAELITLDTEIKIIPRYPEAN